MDGYDAPLDPTEPCSVPTGAITPPPDMRPTDLRLGLIECAWATLSRYMTTPLR